MRTITVKGTGNVSARPDYIILSLNIEANSKNYDLAMSEAAERIEKLQGVAVRVGYRKEDLKTTSFDVQTRYENVKDRQGNYKREFAGYACSYRLKLVRKPAAAGADCRPARRNALSAQLGQPVPPPTVLCQQELHRGSSRFRGSGGVIAP